MRCIEGTVIFGFQGYKGASLVHALSCTVFLKSAGCACTASFSSLQCVCSSYVDKDTQAGSMCRIIQEPGRVDFAHHLFLLILHSAASSWNISFNMSNPGSSDLRENLFIAMNLISSLLAFLPQVWLFLFGCPPYLGTMSLVHSTLIQPLHIFYFSLDHRERRGSFLNLIKGRYQKPVAQITLSCET